MAGKETQPIKYSREGIVAALERLENVGTILNPHIAEQKVLPITSTFNARALLMPGLVEKSIKTSQMTESGQCFFCNPQEAEISHNQPISHRLVANNFPYIDSQVMLATVDHRELLDVEDLIAAINFQRQTHLIGLLNLRGSGANLPDHLHFEFGEAELPILGLPTASDYQYFQDTVITTLSDYPGLVMALEDSNIPRLARNIYLLTQNFYRDRMSFNLIFDDRRILLIPRTAVESRSFPNWRIGSLFLSGLFVPDGRQSQSQEPENLLSLIRSRFETITPAIYRTAITEVTLQAPECPLFIAPLGCK